MSKFVHRKGKLYEKKTKTVKYAKIGTMVKSDALAEARRWRKKTGNKVEVIKSGKFYYLKMTELS